MSWSRQSVLAETQFAILPLGPYIDTLRWAFIAGALCGIEVTIYARLDDWTRAAVIGGLIIAIAKITWMRAALCYYAIVLAVLLFLLSLRRSGERAGRLAERLETSENANDVQRRMLNVAARRPRSRDDLAERLRDGQL